MSGWCAGPAGAGLARLLVGEADACGEEIEQAIANTRGRMGIDRHHACCGEAGRILFLADAAERLDRPALRREALEAARRLAGFHRDAGFLRFQELNERPWTPGLLDGAAGVALALVAASVPGTSNPLSLGIVGGGRWAA
jgi:lantibiotic modifying enzyme